MAEQTKLILKQLPWSTYQELVASNDINAQTIYFISDKGVIYVRGKIYSGKYEFIDEDPTYPELNTLYINNTDLSSKIWNGISYSTMSKGYSITVNDSSTDDTIPTAKAVSTYVQNKIAAAVGVGVGVTDITYSNTDGNIVVTKDGATKNVALNGVAHSPSYDKSTRTLTIPIVGSEALSISFKDNVVSNGKYNTDTKEIWLTIDETGSYDDDTKVIKIPVGELIDIYTGVSTTTATTIVSSDNKIAVAVKISAESDNALAVKSDGLYVRQVEDTTKVDRVESGHVDELISASADGNIKLTGKKIGGGELATTPDSNTIATEISVKKYADAVGTNALLSANTNAQNYATTAETNAKNYTDELIEWINW